jgi:hypothetical protein
VSVSVAFFEAIDAPAPSVRDAMIAILQDLDRSSSSGRGELPHLGVRSIRVAVGLLAHPQPERLECVIALSGAHLPKLFPKFQGTISVSPLREYGCEMWLQGSYDVPFGAVGKAVDISAMHGEASHSLQAFLAWLAEQVKERIGKRDVV